MITITKISILIIAISSIFSPQAKNDGREWLDADLEHVWSIDVSEEIYRPGRGFYVDDAHHIYISDIGDQTIKMFDKQGTYIRAFGEEKGAGPGEIRHPIGFDVDSTGNIWIADPPNSRITIYQNDGTFVEHISIGIIPYRIAVEEDGEAFYIMNQNASLNGLFTKFSKSGEPIKQFGSDIIENQLRNHMALFGEIALGPEDNFYYTPDYAGLILGFNPQGNKQLEAKEIIPTPFPEVIYNAQGGSWIDRDAERVSRGIHADESGRIIITSDVTSSATKKVLDFYDKNTGKYLYSMQLPEYTNQAFLKDRVLYTLKYTTSDLSISAWQVL